MNWFKMVIATLFRTRAYHEAMILFWNEVLRDVRSHKGVSRAFGDYDSQQSQELLVIESKAVRKVVNHLESLKPKHPWRVFQEKAKYDD